MSNYKSKNHSKFTLKYHIIFVCKYRKKLLIKYGEEIKQIIKDISYKYDFDILEIEKWFPSSKMCRFCGNINKELTLADRIWTCICGEVINRDENAAINIMNVGLSMV